jgi:hypothetical protein
MSVWYKQTSDGALTDGPRAIERHYPEQTDLDLLMAKLAGATDKEWKVKKTGQRAFTATKSRWGGVTCVRHFWIE